MHRTWNLKETFDSGVFFQSSDNCTEFLELRSRVNDSSKAGASDKLGMSWGCTAGKKILNIIINDTQNILVPYIQLEIFKHSLGARAHEWLLG